VGGPEVRPFAQIRLAKDDSARRAQPLGYERVARRDVAGEGERAGRRAHLVGRVDVVLDENGDSVQRPADASGLSFIVELRRDRERIRIQLDDRVDCRPALIERVDAREVLLDERSRRIGTAAEAGAEVVDRQLVEGERRNLLRGRQCRTRVADSDHPVPRDDRAGNRSADERAPAQRVSVVLLVAPAVAGAQRMTGLPEFSAVSTTKLPTFSL
jgi:hypothetical protein